MNYFLKQNILGVPIVLEQKKTRLFETLNYVLFKISYFPSLIITFSHFSSNK